MWHHKNANRITDYRYNPVTRISLILLMVLTNNMPVNATALTVSKPPAKENEAKTLTESLKFSEYFLKAGIKPKGKILEYAKNIVTTFPAEERVNALKVVMCESSFNRKATNVNRNGTKDIGLFQLNSGGTLQRLGGDVKDALNPEWNVSAAYVLFQDRGWQPWVCAKKLK